LAAEQSPLKSVLGQGGQRGESKGSHAAAASGTQQQAAQHAVAAPPRARDAARDVPDKAPSARQQPQAADRAGDSGLQGAGLPGVHPASEKNGQKAEGAAPEAGAAELPDATVSQQKPFEALSREGDSGLLVAPRAAKGAPFPQETGASGRRRRRRGGRRRRRRGRRRRRRGGRRRREGGQQVARGSSGAPQGSQRSQGRLTPRGIPARDPKATDGQDSKPAAAQLRSTTPASADNRGKGAVLVSADETPRMRPSTEAQLRTAEGSAVALGAGEEAVGTAEEETLLCRQTAGAKDCSTALADPSQEQSKLAGPVVGLTEGLGEGGAESLGPGTCGTRY